MKRSILVIIPARGGSKGLPGKNSKELCGKPLIGYTIEAAMESDYIDRIVVSTEDKEIAEVSKKFGAEVILRPNELAGDKSPTIESILYTLKYLEENDGYTPEYVALLQCTSPLRNKKHLEDAINELLASERDGIISVCEAKNNPYWTNIIKKGRLEYFMDEGGKITRRQDLPDVYALNGAIYITKTIVLIENHAFLTENTGAYIMDEYDSIDIDNLLDFKIAETILKERYV